MTHAPWRWLGRLGAVLLACAAAAPAFAATPVYKCVVNGSVTYQRDPCPTRGPRVEPTVERLNADEKKRRETAPPARAGEAVKAPAAPASAAALQGAGATPATPAAPAAAPPAPAFRCDGRTRCTQMTSCAEARYFLANCPGVKMDGNHDGVPCQEQWCGSR